MADLKKIKYLEDGKPYNQSHQDYFNQGYTKDDVEMTPVTNGNDGDITRNHEGQDDINEGSDDEDDDENSTACSRSVEKIQKAVSDFQKKNKVLLRTMFYIVIIVAYFVYFGFALYYRFGDEGSWRLLIITALATIGITTKLFLKCQKNNSGNLNHNTDSNDNQVCQACLTVFKRLLRKIRIDLVLPILLFLGFAAYIVAEIAIDKPRNLISLGGMAFFITSFYVCSYNPSKVKWRPVFWGISLQFIFALLILRTSWGYEAFQWMGDRVTEFLAYTDEGSKFVFGNLYENHFFAFKVLPVVVFFSTFVSMMYYLGVMQVVIRQVGKFLSFCLGTSPTESINAAGNIFIGQTEAPLMIRPFLKNMTKSEIHAVMTGGFATIAGSVMAAYILYDVPANHLLSASVMSAPAALAMAKLFYPETEKSRQTADDVYNLAKGPERNLIEAASNGASMSISLVANIAANLIAFVALLGFVNATLVWFGDRVGYDGFTFQLICSYVFWPLAFLMGVDEDDCRVVGELIGTKTFLNEFVAYVDLSAFIKNQITFDKYMANATANVTGNLTGNWIHIDGDIFLNDTGVTLERGLISAKSVVISTYALCGFANLSSMGVQLGALGAMAPDRKGDMSKIVFRAMIAGNVACFMTACIAGLFYEGDI